MLKYFTLPNSYLFIKEKLMYFNIIGSAKNNCTYLWELDEKINCKTQTYSRQLA